ncbi:MAG: zinc ribbon domain-containing protein [Actinomycetota bacterium]|nr:zinc ribbon domain-containing protein [Actinomycetota bacterium]
MPTYELTCHDCGERFELFLMRMLRDADKVCPSCGSVCVQQGVGGGYLGSGTTAAGDTLSARSSCGPGAFT